MGQDGPRDQSRHRKHDGNRARKRRRRLRRPRRHVYRNQGGTWQKCREQRWNNFNRPTGTAGSAFIKRRQRRRLGGLLDQLNRDRGARFNGEAHQRPGVARGSGGSRGSGSTAAGGGARGVAAVSGAAAASGGRPLAAPASQALGGLAMSFPSSGLTRCTPANRFITVRSARPSGLMARPESRAVVAVEMLIEEDEVAPVRILLKILCR